MVILCKEVENFLEHNNAGKVATLYSKGLQIKLTTGIAPPFKSNSERLVAGIGSLI